MVAIMTLSVCAAVGLTTATKVEAHTTTKLSLYTPSEVNYGEYHAISVQLKDGSGHPLANKPVELWYRWSGETTWNYWRTLTTDSGGYRSTYDVDHRVTTVYWKAIFKGDPTYAGSTSVRTMVIKRDTSLSLYAPSTATKYDKFMLSGTLKGFTGGPKTIYLYYRYSGTTTWVYFKKVTTDSGGYYETTVIPSKTVTYYAKFAGDSSHWSSTSRTRTVTVT